jgi:hypothetical protein
MPKGEMIAEINAVRAERCRAMQLTKYEVIKSGCWIWQGGVAQDGYGKVKRFGKTIRAHRLFYEHHIGPVPEGLWVLHKCDTPLCVNPEHLWAGTQLENEQDKDAKGRRPVDHLVRLVEHRGLIKSLSEWERHLGCKQGTIKSRLLRGWDIKKSLTHPFDRGESQRLSQVLRPKNAKGQYIKFNLF